MRSSSVFLGIGSLLARALRFSWVLVVMVGCNERAKECQRFIGTVNRSLREINSGPQPKSDDLAAIASHRKLLADNYRVLAKEVSRLSLRQPELNERAKRYSVLADAAGAALARSVQALDARDSEAAAASQQEFDSIAEQEADLVRDINQLCLGDS